MLSAGWIPLILMQILIVPWNVCLPRQAVKSEWRPSPPGQGVSKSGPMTFRNKLEPTEGIRSTARAGKCPVKNREALGAEKLYI